MRWQGSHDDTWELLGTLTAGRGKQRLKANCRAFARGRLLRKPSRGLKEEVATRESNAQYKRLLRGVDSVTLWRGVHVHGPCSKKQRFCGRADLQFDWSDDASGRAKRPRVIADELEASEMRGEVWDAVEVEGRQRRVKLRRLAVSRMPPLQ